jgi:hypothetical protein
VLASLISKVGVMAVWWGEVASEKNKSDREKVELLRWNSGGYPTAESTKRNDQKWI